MDQILTTHLVSGATLLLQWVFAAKVLIQGLGKSELASEKLAK